MPIDDIVGECVWYVIMQDPESTTREAVIQDKTPLIKCLDCPGQDYECRGYRSAEHLRRIAKEGK
jgi:hypothetical protein